MIIWSQFNYIKTILINFLQTSILKSILISPQMYKVDSIAILLFKSKSETFFLKKIKNLNVVH